MAYKVKIQHTGRTTPKESMETFDVETNVFKSINDADKFVQEHVGTSIFKPVKITSRIYQDVYKKKKLTKTLRTGFTKSFWASAYDREHPGKKYFQTDIVSLSKVSEKPVDIDVLRAKLKHKYKKMP